VKLLQQRCNVLVSSNAVDQSCCRVEDRLQLAKLTDRKRIILHHHGNGIQKKLLTDSFLLLS